MKYEKVVMRYEVYIKGLQHAFDRILRRKHVEDSKEEIWRSNSRELSRRKEKRES